MPFQIATHHIDFYRVTSHLLSASAAATMDPAAPPVGGAYLRVTVADGTSGSGTVTVAGTVAGAGDSEAFVFTQNRSKLGSKLFTALDSNGVTTTGLADEPTPATVTIDAVDGDGQPLQTRSLLASGYPVNWSRNPSTGFGRGYPVRRQGSAETERVALVVPYTDDWGPPRPGDILVRGADEYRIVSVDPSPSEIQLVEWIIYAEQEK